jgi:beta-barrel assembly-enhancing protease
MKHATRTLPSVRYTLNALALAALLCAGVAQAHGGAASAGLGSLSKLGSLLGKKNLTDGVDKARQAMQTADRANKLVNSLRDLTEEEEVLLGESVGSQLLGAAPPLADADVQRYVSQVGMWLAAQSERPKLPWRFVVLDDAEFNAFAAPGGQVFITRGLLYGMNSEAELAGVLAHEIAHVVRQHQLRALKANSSPEKLAELARLAGEVAPHKVPRYQANPLIQHLAPLVVQGILRALDKSDEYEADSMAVVLAARAGYQPYGLPLVLQGLQQVSPNHDGLALLFKTHPSFSSRLDALAGIMGAAFDRFDRQPMLEERFRTRLKLDQKTR